MKFKIILFLILLLIVAKQGFGQNITLDSLFRINKKYKKVDVAKYGIYCRISSSLRFNQPVEALKYADSGIFIAKQLNDHNILAEAYSQRANILLQLGKIDASQRVLDTILSFLSNKKDNDAIMNSEAILYQKGICYETYSQYDRALDMYNKCLRVSNQIHDTSMIFNNSLHIIKIYVSIRDFETALANTNELKTKWVSLYQNAPAKSKLFYVNLSAIFNLLGTIQMQLKDYNESLKSLLRSINICDSVKGTPANFKYMFRLSLAELLIEKKDYEGSYSQIELVEGFFKKSNQAEPLSKINLLLGRM